MGFFQVQEATVCSPEVQDCDSIFCPASCSQDPEFHCLMVTAAKAASSLHISKQPLFVHQGQQHTSLHWLLDHLCQKDIISGL